MIKNQYKKLAIGGLIFTAILLGILAIGKIDYNISLLLLNRKSLWAEFFYIFGEQPAYLGLLVGAVILLSSHKKTNKVLHIICMVAGFFITSILIYIFFMIPMRYIFDTFGKHITNNAKIILAAVSIVISICLTAIMPKYQAKTEKYRRHALFLILVVISELLIVTIMKNIWGRPRMRSISGFDEFRYWYEINGPAANQEFRSFPSGHSANSFTLMAFYVFTPYLKKIKPKVFFAIAVLWGSIVAVSRIVLGAHFLSDVTAGFFITVACIYLYYSLIFNENEQ